MPVSGNEEIGVKPAILRHSSNYPAGIPIKKRRYPMVMPPSPPSEEPSSSPVESNSLQKDQSSPSQGSTLSYSSVATSSSYLSDALKSLEPKERRGSSCVADDHVLNGNDNLANVKVEEPSRTVKLGSLDSMNNKEKLVAARNPSNGLVSGKSELNLAASESLASDLLVSMHVQPSVKVKVEAKTPELRETTEPLLSLKEHFRPVLSSQSSDRSDQNQQSSEPISLNLSLSKESVIISSSKCKSGDVDELNVGSSHLRADRANWDLNIPMDTWVGPLSDMAVSQISLDGIDATPDVKPMTGVAAASEKDTSVERENLTNLSILSNLSNQQYKPNDSLNIRLSPRIQFSGKEQFTAALELNSDKVVPNAKLVRVVAPGNSFNNVNIGAVKSEPVDESVTLETRGAEPSNVESATVKGESCDRGSLETLKTLQTCTKKSTDPRPIKPEPAFDSNNQTYDANKGKNFQLNEQEVHGPDEHSAAVALCKTSETAGPVGNDSFSGEYKYSPARVAPKTAEIASPVGCSFSTEYEHGSAAITCRTTELGSSIVNSSSSTEQNRIGDLSSHLGQFRFNGGNCLEVHQEACENSRQVASDTGATSTADDGKVYVAKFDDGDLDNQEVRKSELANDLPSTRGNGVGAASDEEKVNISADIEVSYGSDYESDGNHAIDMSIDMEIDSEDDYEDGEVRESLEHIAVKEPLCEKGQLERNHYSDLNTGEVDTLATINNANHSASNLEVNDVKTNTAGTDKDGEKASDAAHDDKCERGSGKAPCLQESSMTEIPLGEALLKESNKAVVRSLLDQSGLRGAQEYQETDYKQVINGGLETLPTISQGVGLSENEDLKNDMGLVKLSTNVDNVVKDTDSGSHRSRIINLPRSSDSLSPGGTGSFSGRVLPTRAERERISDLAFEGDTIHSRGREDIYVDGIQKFSRERQHDQTPRNSRLNFMHGRATVPNRLDNLRGDRESNREFASEFYDSPAGFRVPRHKFAASVSDADLEFNSYSVAQDVTFVGSGRGGRKPLNDGGPFIRRLPSRRRSPDGPARGIHMVRRISRNISPNRCVTDNGSELVRPRRNMRGFRDDNMDSMFPHPQPSYEAVDGHFSQGNRNFPSVQRRVMRGIRSKSPLGSRTRSPGAWSSPRRRSPDGFAGHPDLNRQRSPPFYRIERMRSPDRRCFPGEVVVRRQDMRDMDSGRDHGHPGSGMPNNRSPSSRIVIRERRFGGLDPQERREGDDFYGGPMHSGRLHELGGDGNGEDRRFGERRGPLRPYRTFNSADGESFHLNSEDGSRPLRFCSDDNAESQERGNILERDFNRRIKNRPGNAPRRMRNIEEQEANYRHGSQVWHNNSFDDMSRVKRKRY